MPLMDYAIRDYRPGDAARLRECVVVLQEFERGIDPRLRPGDAMADAYCAALHARCRDAGGHLFVADADGDAIGFVALLTRELFTELDDPPGSYALITDLVVLPPHRGRGVGRRLLERAEAAARAAGAPELRIGVLARNLAARRLYLAADFAPHLEVFTKRWPA
jgi:GNAT superfamily N-acetyltransferase